MTSENEPRKRHRDGAPPRSRSPQPRSRSSPPRKRSRSRSPSRSRSRSPPRKRKRPGAGSRINAEDREAVRQRQIEREREQSRLAQHEAAARGVHDVVRQHYNAVPERGREWRKTDSKIKGLRTFNNWVKSALIQKFSADEDYIPDSARRIPSAAARELENRDGTRALKVLDIGCGKGGDLQKWQQAPQRVQLYVGIDPAEVSIKQARDRFTQMSNRRPRGRAPQRPLYHAELLTRDCFGEWFGSDTMPDIIRDVGFDMSLDMDGRGDIQRWGDRGFDVVSMMFCMHYAFESEFKTRTMLRNVSAALTKGGRFLGVIPNSDVLSEKVEQHHDRIAKKPQEYDLDEDWDPEKSLDVGEDKEDGELEEQGFEWGNDIYRVKFPGKTPHDGIFRPPFGWKYFYFLEEAVEEVPEYVVPWEAFRA